MKNNTNNTHTNNAIEDNDSANGNDDDNDTDDDEDNKLPEVGSESELTNSQIQDE